MSKSVPGFEHHLNLMMEIHRRKGKDYATADDPLLNYHRQQQIMAWFDSNEDKMWAGHIVQKLSRIANIRNQELKANREGSDYAPNNEPLSDSFMDVCTIMNLWWCDWEMGHHPPKTAPAQDIDEAVERGIARGAAAYRAAQEVIKVKEDRRDPGFGKDKFRPHVEQVIATMSGVDFTPEEAEAIRDTVKAQTKERRNQTLRHQGETLGDA